jgi:hypothetical protein
MKTGIYIMIASPRPAERHRSHRPVEVFTDEALARDAFRRLRVQVGGGSGWGELVVLDEGRVRPLCWFGRPPEHGDPEQRPSQRSRPRWRPRRWGLAALAVGVVAVLWLSVDGRERAGAAVAPYVSRTALVTVTQAQRAEVTAVNLSDACHRMDVALVDGEGAAVASDSSIVCPGKHLAVSYSPSAKVRLRSVVAMHLVPQSIVGPCSHSFEVQDIETGRVSVTLSRP